MGKKITIISANFYPEDTSTGLYTTQMAEYLREIGYEISVITGFPYYPQWEIWPEYREKAQYIEENLKGIKILRYKQYTPKHPSFKERVKHILSFSFGNIKNLRKIHKADLIIAIVPFTSNVLLAHLLAKKVKAKVWVHIQDFEFDAAFESGIIKNSKLKFLANKVLNFIESSLYNKADVVSTISYSMVEKAKAKTKTEVFYFPNWVDDEFINPEKARVHPLLNSKKFKILYSGNIGEKQDWEFFLKVVSSFQHNEKIEFIVVGDGAKKNWLVREIHKFKNVKHYQPVSYEELPNLLCSADLHILFQKPEVKNTVMPSKLLGMMASGKPSLVTGNRDSEVARIIKLSKAGEFYESGSLDEVIRFIKIISRNKSMAENYGSNARNYVVSNYSKSKVLNRFKLKVEKVLKT